MQADLDRINRGQFRYVDKGMMATVGRTRAVAQVGRWRFGGVFAWFAWLAVHLFYLVGFKNRVSVLFSWIWQYVVFRRGARLITHAEFGQPPGPLEAAEPKAEAAPQAGVC